MMRKTIVYKMLIFLLFSCENQLQNLDDFSVKIPNHQSDQELKHVCFEVKSEVKPIYLSPSKDSKKIGKFELNSIFCGYSNEQGWVKIDESNGWINNESLKEYPSPIIKSGIVSLLGEYLLVQEDDLPDKVVGDDNEIVKLISNSKDPYSYGNEYIRIDESTIYYGQAEIDSYFLSAFYTNIKKIDESKFLLSLYGTYTPNSPRSALTELEEGLQVDKKFFDIVLIKGKNYIIFDGKKYYKVNRY
ncbi:MAG: hypothetical protein H3C43_06255 [Leptonema sp. (in: Bacteria)]|nr:hypothetical protein [Leptonema sp. (in: bacteria)]